MAEDVSGGHFDRRAARIAGECRGRVESADLIRLWTKFGGSEGANAVELGQCGAGGLDGDLDVVSGFVDPAVEPAQLRDQVRGQCAQCLAGGVSGRTVRSSSAA